MFRFLLVILRFNYGAKSRHEKIKELANNYLIKTSLGRKRVLYNHLDPKP